MKNIVQKFLKDIAIPENSIFLGHGPDGANWFTAKRELVMETDGIYCHLGDRDPNGNNRTCKLIGLVNYENRTIRFFDNETLRGMFSADELEELKKLSGGKFLSFEQISKDFLHSFDVESSDENKLYPLPDDVGCSDYDDYHDYNMFEYLLNTQKFMGREALNTAMDGITELDNNGYDDAVIYLSSLGWYGDISCRWLASATSPEYPNFDMKHEWDLFVKDLDEMKEEDLSDPNSNTKKYIDMQKAVEGQSAVKIVFSLTDGSETAALIDSCEFKSGNVILTDYGPIINLDKCYLDNMNDFEEIRDLLHNRNEFYGKAKYWIKQKNIKRICDSNGETIWPVH